MVFYVFNHLESITWSWKLIEGKDKDKIDKIIDKNPLHGVESDLRVPVPAVSNPINESITWSWKSPLNYLAMGTLLPSESITWSWKHVSNSDLLSLFLASLESITWSWKMTPTYIMFVLKSGWESITWSWKLHSWHYLVNAFYNEESITWSWKVYRVPPEHKGRLLDVLWIHYMELKGVLPHDVYFTLPRIPRPESITWSWKCIGFLGF